MIKLIRLSLLVTVVCSLLSACAPPEPTMFGIPQSQWQALTKQQQDAVIKGYNERQATETANQPYYAAINASQQFIEASQQKK